MLERLIAHDGYRMLFRRFMGQRSLQLPRALAVLSCALALLAAEPVMAHAGSGRLPGGAGRVAVTVAEAAGGLPKAAGERREVGSGLSRQARVQTWGSAGGRLHILATFEILHRLLLAELQAPASVERLLIPAVMLEPVAVELVTPPLVRTQQGHLLNRQAYRTPPPERQYVILHCLLAPPTV